MQKEPTNVIDFRSKKPLLPFQVRAILMAQYAQSRESEHNAELFVVKVEERLLAAGAATIVDFVRGFFEDAKGNKDE